MPNTRNRLIDFAGLKIDALLVSFGPNVRYLTGFTGSNGVALVTPDDTILFTDPRYTIRAKQEFGGSVVILKGALGPAVIGRLAKRKRRMRLGFEASRVSYADFQAMSKSLGSQQRLTPTQGVIEGFRMVKDAEEIAAIRASVEVNSQAFERVLKGVKEGVTEKEIAAELEYQQILMGAEGKSFETIVAFGKRGALPHANPTAARLGRDVVILIDMGACLNGYASDMTRMAVLGNPPAGFKRMYKAVLDAQLAAIDAVREGVTAASVDRAARQVLRDQGMDKLFVHSTGHGLGLEIHEAPGLRKTDKTRLKAGMVITIEPGVYKEGYGGVRIEDTLAVTKTGCEVLTPTTKELIHL